MSGLVIIIISTWYNILFLVPTVNEKLIRYVYSSTVYGVYSYIFCTIAGNRDNYNNWPVIDQTKQLNR